MRSSSLNSPSSGPLRKRTRCSSAFAETHALALRDFVVSGVEIAHQFRVEDIERLTGDNGGVLRVDVWDRLKSHIAAAEAQFQRQVLGMREEIDAYRAPPSGADGASEAR